MKTTDGTNNNSLRRKFESKETWLFDLDNTLYPASCRLFDQIDRNITTYISEYLALEWEPAYNLQKSFFKKHGTTLRGLMIEHGIDPHHYLEYVHDIDLSPISPNLAFNKALTVLPGRKIIFTNGSVKHAKNVLSKLGILDHFETMFDIVASDFLPKPEPVIYDKLVKKYAIYAPTSVMIEDIAWNLKPAHQLGMTCVWIRSNNYLGSKPDYENHIDYIIDDLTTWLCSLTETQ
ncbi:MAG: pyrimidine 5'-nucleotidase [Magnetovibrio sp.]|nr:pyrimidine 5'-nucleotidase [Magnetovibrio sp.]